MLLRWRWRKCLGWIWLGTAQAGACSKACRDHQRSQRGRSVDDHRFHQGHPGRREIKIPHSQPVGGARQNRSTAGTFYGACQEQSRPRPFVLEAEEPALLLGKDAAANPAEHLAHGLADCVTWSMSITPQLATSTLKLKKSSLRWRGTSICADFLNSTGGFAGDTREFASISRSKPTRQDQQLQAMVELGTSHSPVFRFANQPISLFLDVPHLFSDFLERSHSMMQSRRETRLQQDGRYAIVNRLLSQD
jgi:hypothetical protein